MFGNPAMFGAAPAGGQAPQANPFGMPNLDPNQMAQAMQMAQQMFGGDGTGAAAPNMANMFSMFNPYGAAGGPAAAPAATSESLPHCSRPIHAITPYSVP